MQWHIILRQIRAGERCQHYKVVEGEGHVCVQSKPLGNLGLDFVLKA